MSRTATRLHGPALVSNAAATKITAAAATKVLIRHIHISNPSAAAVAFTMSIGTDATAVRIFDGFSIPAVSVFDHFGFYVVDAAELVQAFAGTNNILTLTISGEVSILS